MICTSLFYFLSLYLLNYWLASFSAKLSSTHNFLAISYPMKNGLIGTNSVY